MPRSRSESAQRLSASKVLSHCNMAKAFYGSCPVLNAFRHQRYFHTCDEQERRDSHGFTHVLNAFRHQRYFHKETLTAYAAKHKCSTPFGIKGTFTAMRSTHLLHPVG